MRMKRSRSAAAPQPPASGAELARAFAQARVFAQAGACLCAGGVHAGLEPKDVAQDVLFYLAEKYRAEGRATLLALVRQVDPADFETWLAALDDMGMTEQERATLIADLAPTIESLRAPAGFMCV
ncbi:MAG TPA: hypothetical protein VIL72_08085 [Beijerinckiaceae bacterium]|jgi:hypothetical protein